LMGQPPAGCLYEGLIESALTSGNGFGARRTLQTLTAMTLGSRQTGICRVRPFYFFVAVFFMKSQVFSNDTMPACDPRPEAFNAEVA
jgi:hypothetical protein